MRRKARPADPTPHRPDEPHGESAFVWLFLGLFLLVPVVPWPFLHWNALTFEIFPPAESLVFVTLTLAAGLFAVRAVQYHFRHLTLQPLDLAVFVFYLYAALSTLWSETPPLSRDVGLAGLAMLTFYVLAKHAVLRKDMVGPVVACLQIAIALNNVYAIGQLLRIGPMLFGSGEEPIGLLGNRNHLAYFLAITLPVGLFRAWTPSRTLHRLGRVNFYVSCIVLWFTGCRGGLLAGLVTLACFHVFKREQDRAAQRVKKPMPQAVRWAIIGAVAFSAFALFGAGFLYPEKIASARSRLFTWNLVVRAVGEAPILGHGAGTFGNVFHRVQAAYFGGLANKKERFERGTWRLARSYRHAHNEYLQVACELGLVGLALMLAIVFLALRDFLGGYLSHGNLERIRWYPLFGSMFIGGLVQALTGFPFQIVPVMMVFGFSLAVISALSLDETASHVIDALAAEEDRRAPWKRAFFAVPWLLISLYALNDAVARWRAEGAYFRGMKELHAGNLDRAETALVSAIADQPSDGRAWNQLGQVFYRGGRFAEAETAFLRGGVLFRNPSAPINLACVFAVTGRMDLARAYFEHAVAMDPFNTETHYQLGYLEATLGRFEAAAEALRRAMTISYRDFKVTWTFARVLADMGKGAEAERQFRQNIDLLRGLIREEDPSGRTVDARYRHWITQNLLSLAALYEREKKADKANECYAEARAYDKSVRPVGPAEKS
jgi:O-antigen ligase/Flp pilus assembly protein TadD